MITGTNVDAVIIGTIVMGNWWVPLPDSLCVIDAGFIKSIVNYLKLMVNCELNINYRSASKLCIFTILLTRCQVGHASCRLVRLASEASRDLRACKFVNLQEEAEAVEGIDRTMKTGL